MSERVYADRPSEKSRQHDFTAEEAIEMRNAATEKQKELRASAEGLDEETEALLDEIEDLLEDNATEFVNYYIQEGGE